MRAGSGNPFVLTELARAPERLGVDGELPDSLQRLGAALVDALPAPVRSVVRDAATFGSTVPLAEFAELLGRPELSDDRWWSATFPVLRPGAPGTVEFRNDALRVAAHDSLTFRRRRQLHGAIAERLARRVDASEGELAFHYEQAGMAIEAYTSARVAGLAAKASGAMAEACDLLALAIRLALAVAPHAVGELQLERGEALALLGDLDAADAAFVGAGRRLTEPLAYARMCHGRAGLALTRSRFRQARTWVRKGLDALAALGDGAAHQRGRLLLDHAAVFDLTGRHEQSLAPAGEALALATRTGDRTLEGLAHLHLGMAHVAMMRPEALDHVEAAVAIFEAAGHDRYLNSSLNNSGLVAMYLGRWDDAIERYRRAAEHGRLCGNTSDRAIVEMNIGFLLYRQGHLDDAEAYARRSLRTFDAVGVTQQSGIARYLLSQIAAADGRYDDAATAMASARATFVELGDAAMIVDCDVASMEQAVDCGRLDAGRSMAAVIAPRLDAAEPEVVITHQRTLGRLELLDGDAAGSDRIEAALASASKHQLAYAVYLCLDALVEAGRTDRRAERDDLATELGIRRDGARDTADTGGARR